MLPLLDGLTIVQTLRSSGNKTPVLILSALGEIDDRVRGLRAGGDDYLVKPFAFSELLARLEALVRRARAETPETTLRVGDLEMDLLARVVKRAGQTIDLQPREFVITSYSIHYTKLYDGLDHHLVEIGDNMVPRLFFQTDVGWHIGQQRFLAEIIRNNFV